MEFNSSILVVEDEGIIAGDIAQMLRMMGYRVSGMVGSGQEAIEHVRHSPPDLALMDIQLFGPMDGIEAGAVIHRDYDVPVVYLTAYADEEMLERAKLTDPFGYLIKPFEGKALQFAIEMALMKSRMERELKQINETYRKLLETAGAVPWEMDARTVRFTYMGPQVKDLLGYEPGEVTDLAFLESRIHPDDREQAHRFSMRSASIGENHEMQYRMVDKYGGVVHIRDIVSVESGPEGPIKLRGFFLDITREKLIEQERARLVAAYADSRTKVSALLGLLTECPSCGGPRAALTSKDHERLGKFDEALPVEALCQGCRAQRLQASTHAQQA